MIQDFPYFSFIQTIFFSYRVFNLIRRRPLDLSHPSSPGGGMFSFKTPAIDPNYLRCGLLFMEKRMSFNVPNFSMSKRGSYSGSDGARKLIEIAIFVDRAGYQHFRSFFRDIGVSGRLLLLLILLLLMF